MSTAIYFLNNSKHQKPVFVDENNKFYILNQCRVNKITNSISYYCQKRKSQKCNAKVFRFANGMYSIKNEHSCEGLSESQMHIKLQIHEIENQVFFLY